MSRIQCHWCKKFIAKGKGRATVKEPNIFYCSECYDKGLREEYEAMGLYDKQQA